MVTVTTELPHSIGHVEFDVDSNYVVDNTGLLFSDFSSVSK